MVTRLREYLDREGIRYSTITHSAAYTAQQLAAAAHVPGRDFAKCVVVKTAGGYALAVLPAHHRIDVAALSRLVGGDVRLATEDEFAQLFPECELGAMPALGNLYGLGVFVSEPLARDEEIVFNAGTHREALRMRYADFARLAGPKVGAFSLVAAPAPRREPKP